MYYITEMSENSEIPQKPVHVETMKEKSARLRVGEASAPSFPTPGELTPQEKRQEALADAVRLSDVRSELTAKNLLNIVANYAADGADKNEQK